MALRAPRPTSSLSLPAGRYLRLWPRGLLPAVAGRPGLPAAAAPPGPAAPAAASSPRPSLSPPLSAPPHPTPHLTSSPFPPSCPTLPTLGGLVPPSLKDLSWPGPESLVCALGWGVPKRDAAGLWHPNHVSPLNCSSVPRPFFLAGLPPSGMGQGGHTHWCQNQASAAALPRGSCAGGPCLSWTPDPASLPHPSPNLVSVRIVEEGEMASLKPVPPSLNPSRREALGQPPWAPPPFRPTATSPNPLGVRIVSGISLDTTPYTPGTLRMETGLRHTPLGTRTNTHTMGWGGAYKALHRARGWWEGWHLHTPSPAYHLPLI